jgi:hypothetical protein
MHHLSSLRNNYNACNVCQWQRERKLDVFPPTKKPKMLTGRWWLDAVTFSKHKIMLAPKFTHLLGDALGPKGKEATTTESA